MGITGLGCLPFERDTKRIESNGYSVYSGVVVKDCRARARERGERVTGHSVTSPLHSLQLKTIHPLFNLVLHIQTCSSLSPPSPFILISHLYHELPGYRRRWWSSWSLSCTHSPRKRSLRSPPRQEQASSHFHLKYAHLPLSDLQPSL